MVSIAIDQSLHPVTPVFEAVESSAFFICSVRLVPAAFSHRADLYLDLGGGSARDLNALLAALSALPAVISTAHFPPPV